MGDYVKLSLIGLSAGLFSSLFGIGGGVVIVPSLLMLLNFDFKKAVGTSLVSIILIASFGLLSYALINTSNIFSVAIIPVVAGSFFGVFLGSKLGHKLPTKFLKVIFAFFLFFMSFSLMGFIDYTAFEPSGPVAFMDPVLLMVGFVGGFASALLGIGGGVVFVPGLNIFAGFPIQGAIVASLGIIVLTSIFGSFFHKNFGNVDMKYVKIILPFAFVGALGGIVITTLISAPDLTFLFGVFELIVGFILLLDFFK